MRRTLPLAVLICGMVLATGAAGYAVARGAGDDSLGLIGRAAAAPGGTLVEATTEFAATTGRTPTMGATQPRDAAPVVTVPALTTSTSGPSTAGSTPARSAPARLTTARSSTVPSDEEAGQTAPSSGRRPSAAATPPGRPTPVTTASPAAKPRATTPAHPAVRPPYNAVLGWYGQAKVAYLTFDDGPGPATGRVLDVLARYRVNATFCQIGQRVAENPAVAQRVTAAGHTVCNHSWDHHSPFDALPVATLDREIGRTQQTIAAATGQTARYFRAPEGRFGLPGGQVMQAAQRAGTIPLAWGVDSLDWTKPGARKIVSNVLSAVTPGAVILLHDGGGADREQTIAALPGIISGLRAAGYALAALPADPPR